MTTPSPEIYRLRQSSPGMFIVVLLATMYAGAGLLIVLAVYDIITIHNFYLFLICYAPVVVLAFYLTRIASRAEIEITMDEEGLKLKWIRPFFFTRKQDDEFAWNEIADYVYEPDRAFDRIRFHLKDGYRFSVRHNNDDDGKDDFRRFLNDFTRRVEQRNNADRDLTNDILLGKTMFESTAGLVMAFILILVMIAAPVTMIFFPSGKPPKYLALAACYIAAGYFVARVFSARKQRKAYEARYKQIAPAEKK